MASVSYCSPRNISCFMISRKFIISFFLFFSISPLAFSQDTTKVVKPIPQNSLKANFFRYAAGEMNIYYERPLRLHYNLEGSLAYVFVDLYNSDNNISGMKMALVKGIAGSIGLKYFPKATVNNVGFYMESMLYYKRLKRDSVEMTALRDERDNSLSKYYSICSECVVVETDHKQVFAPQFLFGYQKVAFQSFFFDLYAGLGFRFKVFDLDIHRIDDYQLHYTFNFDDYQVRIYKYYPTVNLGVKLGYAF